MLTLSQFCKPRLELNWRFWRGFVAHKLLKARAYKLFGKGQEPPEVAEKLGAALRSVQRWHQQFLSENPEFQEIKKASVAIIPLEQLEKTESHTESAQTQKQLEAPSTESGNNFLASVAESHFEAHKTVRERIQKLLICTLEAPEPAIRTIHTLSMALHRHLEGEAASVGLPYFVNINASYKALTAAGYEVIDPNLENSTEASN